MKVKRSIFVVSLPAHEVAIGEYRWPVPERRQQLHAPDRAEAVRRVVRYAHADASVPPYRSLLRQTAALAAVTTEIVEVQRGGS